MRNLSAALAMLVVALGAACRSDGGTEVRVPATVTVTPSTVALSAIGASQSLTAIVRDQIGNVISGQAVMWTSTNTGVASVSTSGVVTAAGNGTATVRATAGAAAGTATVTVAQAVAALVNVSGDGQTAAAGTALPTPLVVRASDANSNAVAGVTVQLVVTQGGGSLSAESQVTGANGETAGVTWTLGTTAGASQEVTASVAGVSPATFQATVTAGPASQVALLAGNTQTATVNTPVAVAPSVIVRDAFANPVPGVPVTFTVTGGGGSVTGGNATTDANGIATVGSWILGTAAGSDNNTLQAASAGLTGSPVTFTASTTAGSAAQLALDAGDNQTATVNTPVAVAPSVIVRDQFSNPVQGVAVTFTVTGGGGSVTGGNATTDANGIAAVTTWTLGTTAGTDNNTLQAASAGLAGSPVTFTASAAPGAAARISKAAGDGQSATAGTSVAVDPAVLVADEFDNPVAGVIVTFEVTAGGGTIGGATPASGPDGLATAGPWTLGTTAGANTLSATAPTLIGSPLTFTATGTPGSPSVVALSAGDAQTDTVGATLPVAYAVLVTDAAGNPVSGITVAWAVTGDGGSVIPASSITDANGIATTTRTLGTTAGVQTATAAVTGLAGSPVPFTATATAGAATQLALNAGNDQAATVNTAVAIDPSVLVHDQFGNPAPGVAVAFAVTGGGGSVTGGNAATDGSGIATVGSWTLGTTAGTSNNTLAATSTGLTGSPVTFTATATAGPAASVAAQAGNNQTGPSGLALPVDPAVIVRDAFANPVPNAIVTFAATLGGGSVTGAVDTTGVNGVATVGDWILGAPGTNQLTATVTGAGITGNPVTFTATATGGSGAPASVAVFAGDGQTGLVGFAVNVPPAVIVRDGTNAPLANVQVDFAVTGGGGQVTAATATTGADGVARVGSWVLGGTPSPNALSATVAAAGVSGNPVAFSATGATQQYDIEVRFLTPVTAAQQAAFDSAEARWERLLYGELTDIPFNRGPTTCAGVQIPGVHETIDDLVIFVRLDSIDGPLNILGSAGPCFIRGGDTLPVLGAMQFDTADVASFLDAGLFDEIVMHEMGHVIGVGTVWSLKGRVQDPVLSGGTDPHFDGPEAIAAFDRSGGADYAAGAKVPVENTGGAGTADAHWRESVFDNELMTGFLNLATNPLSVVSVASLADVGYLRANYAGADPYVVGGGALRAGPAPRIPFGPDVYLGLVTFVDALGRAQGTARLRP